MIFKNSIIAFLGCLASIFSSIPLFAYVLQGTLIVERENVVRKEFKAGSAVAEMLDEYHLGVNEGKEPLILIAFYLGGDQKPLAIRREDL